MQYNKMDLRKHLGRMEQLAGIRQTVAADGRAAGTRLMEINNGSGLEFTVMPDRALDVCDARFKGVPFAWVSPNGIVHPSYYEPEGFRWLRSWPGGLVCTAGWLNVGGPDHVSGDDQGLHGRVSHLPAERLTASSEWVDDAHFRMEVGGVVRHTAVFGEKLEMHRRIATELGRNVIEINDTIENVGFAPTPLLMLYHCNFGYPLIAEESRLTAVPHEVEPRDDHAKKDAALWDRMQAPTSGYAEEVFYHRIPAGADGFAAMTVDSPAAGMKMTISYKVDQLPVLVQWKMMGESEYATGLECGNCVPEGQGGNAKRGLLQTLQPGEKRDFAVRIAVEER